MIGSRTRTFLTLPGSSTHNDDDAHDIGADYSNHTNYPLYKYLMPRYEYRKPRRTMPTVTLRLMRARLSRLVRLQWAPFYTRPKSNVLYARDEPSARSTYVATHDVRRLPILRNDSTLVRIGDAFEISVVGFCLPTSHLANPIDSRRLLYSIHSKGSASYLSAQSQPQLHTKQPQKRQLGKRGYQRSKSAKLSMTQSASFGSNKTKQHLSPTNIMNHTTSNTTTTTSISVATTRSTPSNTPFEDTECRVHYDDYVNESYPVNYPQAYAGVPASRSLFARIDDAIPCDFPINFRVLETGSVGDVHSRMLQTLSRQSIDHFGDRKRQLQKPSIPSTKPPAGFTDIEDDLVDDDMERVDDTEIVDEDEEEDEYSTQNIPGAGFLPHVTTAIQAAAIARATPKSKTIPPRMSAAISATFCVSAEKESYQNNFDENFTGRYNSLDPDFDDSNFEPPIPLRYGYFILFEKTVKNRVYVNTETSELTNPLSILNVPLEHVCYVILRVSRGVSNIPMRMVSARHKNDAMRVESLLQLGEAIRIIGKL